MDHLDAVEITFQRQLVGNDALDVQQTAVRAIKLQVILDSSWTLPKMQTRPLLLPPGNKILN